MTRRTTQNRQEPVLLSWRMPPFRRLAIAVISTAVASVLAYTALRTFEPMLPGLGLVIGIIVVLAVLHPSVRVISAFECTASGMRIARLDPGKIARLPWESITTLKRLAGPLIILNHRRGWYLFFALPQPILRQLISLLREASNARIIGLGEGE